MQYWDGRTSVVITSITDTIRVLPFGQQRQQVLRNCVQLLELKELYNLHKSPLLQVLDDVRLFLMMSMLRLGVP